MPAKDAGPDPVRLVYEEDGYPQELLTAADRAKAVANGLIQPRTAVTVYRGDRAPNVMPASEVDELAQLLLPVETAPRGTKPAPIATKAAVAKVSQPTASSRSGQPVSSPRRSPPPPTAGVPRPTPTPPAATVGSANATQPPAAAPKPSGGSASPGEPSQSFWSGEQDATFAEPVEAGGYRPDRRPVLVVFALIATALIAVLILVARPTPAPAASETRIALRRTNVRAAPDVNSAVVGQLQAGDAVTGAPADSTGAADWFHVTAGPLADRYVWMRNLGRAQNGASTPPIPTASPVQPSPMPTPSPSPTAAPCTGTSCRTLTAQGWGDVRAGMTLAELASTGISLIPLEKPGEEAPTEDPSACIMRGVAGGPGNLIVFVENGVVTSVGAGLEDGPRFATDRGVGFGEREAAVRRAYSRLEQTPDIYGGPRDKKLFYRLARGQGIKFSIVDGKVVAIAAGGRSIDYVEGCL